MEALPPSSPTTLLLLLGASAWPFSPDFQSSEAFANAAQQIKAYFLHPGPFGLPEENLLDLFDSTHSPDELDVEMRQFLEQRLAAMQVSGHAARDILVYFVGHGGFVGREADFYLAIRRTRMDNPRPSGLQINSLADTLMEKGRYLRRIIILDCCFAAAAFSAFQSEPAQVALEKTRDAFAVKGRGTGFPGKGTVLLCSSNHTSPSLLLPDGSSTMFTKALVDALMQGATPQHEYVSLREVAGLTAQALMGIRNAPRPIVLSPDQSEGDIADIPFFPNPRAEEEPTHLERRRLGRYRLLRLLGSGGMGEVYLAEDASIGQQVAIKVIRAEGVAYPESESAKEAERLFEREARAIVRLDHPNILPLYAYGEEMLHGMQLTYLVMPYRKEGTLASWLRRRGSAAPLSPAEVAPLLQQAADALQHAHNQHVLHQDIKPSNFLIRLRDDQPDRPDLFLADFGIAKLMSATGSLSQSIRGTPTYMAPEQWDGHPVAASDQYALAIMVYELLVGRPPFIGNPSQVMRQHYLVPAPAPSSLNAHLSPAIDAVLLCALAKGPDERFPSVTAFARAFHEAMQSEEALHATLAISRTEAESGTTRTLTLPGGRQVSVTVPAGVGDGTSLRLEGQGMPFYEGGPTGPLVLTIAIPAEASPPPPPQDSTEPTIAGSLPDEERPAVEDQRVPPARPEVPGELERKVPAPHESESAPTFPTPDAPSLPAPPFSPPTPEQTKRRRSSASAIPAQSAAKLINMWAFGKKQFVTMLILAACYSIISYVLLYVYNQTISASLHSSFSNFDTFLNLLWLELGLLFSFPIFLAAFFGPWVGTGGTGIGFFLAYLIYASTGPIVGIQPIGLSEGLFFLNGWIPWETGIILMFSTFLAGLILIKTKGQYTKVSNILFAWVLGVIDICLAFVLVLIMVHLIVTALFVGQFALNLLLFIIPTLILLPLLLFVSNAVSSAWNRRHIQKHP